MWKSSSRSSCISGWDLDYSSFSSRALHTSLCIYAARPTIPTLKAQRLYSQVFQHKSTREKLFHRPARQTLKTEATNRWHTPSPRRRTIKYLGHLIPKWHFHQPPAMLQPEVQQGWDALLRVTSQQKIECWTFLTHSWVKQAVGHHGLYFALT